MNRMIDALLNLGLIENMNKVFDYDIKTGSTA